MEEKYINQILNYIKDNFEDEAIIKPRYLYDNNIYIASKKYDLNISIEKTTKDNYLYGKSEYCLHFDYDANKKYRVEEMYCGGDHCDPFNEKDFSCIDSFLKEFCKRKTFKQMTIFDLEGGIE